LNRMEPRRLAMMVKIGDHPLAVKLGNFACTGEADFAASYRFSTWGMKETRASTSTLFA
jgi:hypothetical protein